MTEQVKITFGEHEIIGFKNYNLETGDFSQKERDSTVEKLIEMVLEMQQKIVVLEMQISAINAWRDDDETYHSEQNERR